MTSNSPDVTEEILTILQSTGLACFCVVATSTLVLYDHAATFSREIELIWGRKWSSVVLLYYLNRWTTFIWALEQVVFSFMSIDTLPSCIVSNDFSETITVLLFIIWAVFSGVRMYAVSGGSWWLASVVCLLNVVPIGTNAYVGFFGVSYMINNLPVLGEWCSSGPDISQATNIAFSISARICVIIAEVLLLLITWSKTYVNYRDAVRNNIKTPLAGLLLKDGTLYFIMLLALNIINVAGNIDNVFTYTATFFTTPLSSLIITHFLLDLRHVAYAPPNNSLDTSHPSFIRSQDGTQPRSRRSHLSFNSSFVDNMGEDLDYSLDMSNPDNEVSYSDDSCTEENRTANKFDEETLRINSGAGTIDVSSVSKANGLLLEGVEGVASSDVLQISREEIP